jgi:hypothetical protein
MRIDGPQITGSFNLNGDTIGDLDTLVTTSSLNAYTSSIDTTMGHVNTATHSLNTFTSSATTRLNSIETSSGSLNSYTSSNNTKLGVIESTTASLNSYTSSNTTNINAIHTSTGSLNTFTSSATTRLNSIEGVSGSYATTGSNQFKNDQVITGSLTVTGFIDAQELRTTYISSSILYRSGSTKFGDELSDTHTFTGSLLVSGSVLTTGTATFNSSATANSLISTSSGEDGATGPVIRLTSTNSNAGTRNWAMINSWDNFGDLTFRVSNAKDGNALSAGSSKMVILSSGNVGIGLTMPQSILHLYTATSRNIPALGTAGGHQIIQTGGVIATCIGVNANGNYWIQPQHINDGGSTVYSILLAPSGGNVGIGTTDPLSKLHVNGNLRIVGNQSLIAGNSNWFRKTFEVDVTTWSDVVSFTPQSGTQYTAGFINITASAYVNGGLGTGVVTSKWSYTISNNVITIGVVGSDIIVGSAPSVRLIVSSNVINVQVQSYNTAGISFTTVYVESFLGSGYINSTSWVIS